ncbi:hypothetical protein D9M72_360190 [compost metagenome]
MGFERPGQGAAVDQLEHRGFHLDVVAAVQAFPDGTGDRGAGVDHLAGFITDHQVHVALADAGFLVQAGVQNRQRAQRLRRHGPGVGHNGQFAAAGGDDLTLDEDVVAQVHQGLPFGQGLFAHVGKAQHGLQACALAVRAAFLERGEAELAGVPDEHDAACDAHNVSGGLVGLKVRVLLPDLTQGMRAFNTHRIGLDAALNQLGALLHANAHLLAGVRRFGSINRGGGVLGSHNP